MEWKSKNWAKIKNNVTEVEKESVKKSTKKCNIKTCNLIIYRLTVANSTHLLMQFELNFKGLELLLFILWSKVICSSFAELFSVSVHNKTVFQCTPLHYNKMGSNTLWNHIRILTPQKISWDSFYFFIRSQAWINDWRFKLILDIFGA